MKTQEFKKNEEMLRNLWDNFKHSNIRIIGVPEREEEQQEIENLFEKNNERKLSQSDKRNKYISPGSSENPKQVGPKEEHTIHIIIKLPKIEDKEKILKAAIEKESYLQRSSHKTIS